MMYNEETESRYLPSTFTWQQAFDASNEGKQVIAIGRIRQEGEDTYIENHIYLLMSVKYYSSFDEKSGIVYSGWQTRWLDLDDSRTEEPESIMFSAESADSPFLED